MRALKPFLLVCLLFVPALASAQASIAGVVRDSSGGVLPGVTVEASSPALIEKTRSVLTDGSGQYKIIELRPGTYDVTFSLPGVATVKREGSSWRGPSRRRERGDEGRLGDGNGDREWREPDCGRSEHDPAACWEGSN